MIYITEQEAQAIIQRVVEIYCYYSNRYGESAADELFGQLDELLTPIEKAIDRRHGRLLH